MLGHEEEEHALERLAEVQDEIRQVEKQLQDLRRQWEMEKSGLGDIQKVRERLDAVKVEYSRAWDEIRHMQQRGERPDEGQFQALAALDAERKALEKRIAEAEALGDGQPKEASRLLKKEVDSEEIAEVVSQWTGIPVSRMLTTEREKLLEAGRPDPSENGRTRTRPFTPSPTPSAAAGPACKTPTGRSGRSCFWDRPASARPSWPRPWPSSCSTARRPWSAST